MLLFVEVTAKAAGLNPNAKVWQEIAAQGGEDGSPKSESSWQDSTPHTIEPSTEGCSDDAKIQGQTRTPPSESPAAVNGMDPTAGEADVPLPRTPRLADGRQSEERAHTTEDLREDLKKQLEFCFSR
uniref:la-related protein 4-like n=1 Tax=Pristiophorus japonicus TaxID=55135 RepID=UPI00398F5A05